MALFKPRSKKWTWETEPLPQGYGLTLVPSELDVLLLLNSPCCNGHLLSSHVCDSCGRKVRDGYAKHAEKRHQCKRYRVGIPPTAEEVADQAAQWYADVLASEIDPLTALVLANQLATDLFFLRTRQLELIREWSESFDATAIAHRKRSWRFWESDAQVQKRIVRAHFQAEERYWQQLIREYTRG